MSSNTYAELKWLRSSNQRFVIFAYAFSFLRSSLSIIGFTAVVFHLLNTSVQNNFPVYGRVKPDPRLCLTVTNTLMIAGGPNVWMLSEVLTMPCSFCTDWHRLGVKQWRTGVSHGSKMPNLCKSNRRQYSWEKCSENILWGQYLCQFKEGNCWCKSIKRKYWSNSTLLKTFVHVSQSKYIISTEGALRRPIT